MPYYTFVPHLFPEESLLSFIFRIEMMYSSKKSPDLITEKGIWKKYIKLSPECQKIIIQYTDIEILKLLDMIGVIEHPYSYLYNPVRYMHEMENLITGLTVKINIFQHIVYCPDCVRNFIVKYGVGYLKNEWISLYPSKRCSIHNTPLHEVLSHSRRDTIDVLISIFKGKEPKAFRTVYYSNDDCNQELEIEELDPSIPYLSICLSNKIKLWLLNKKDDFSYEFIRVVGCKPYMSSRRVLQEIISNECVFEEAYKYLFISNYLNFHEFFSNYCEYHKFYYGVINKMGLQGEIAKLKGSNCSKCYEKYCPANLIIYDRYNFYYPSDRGYICFKLPF